MKITPWFTHPQVILCVYDFLLLDEYKIMSWLFQVVLILSAIFNLVLVIVLCQMLLLVFIIFSQLVLF